jgi:four helix bundle protein
MQKELIEKNPILKHSIDFSLATINYCETLDAAKKYIISKQLFRSATSIGANSMEAQNAESRADFIHKIKIAAKEADETQYWLTLCTYAKDYPSCSELSSRLVEIQKLLNSILYTSKKKNPISYLLSFLIF